MHALLSSPSGILKHIFTLVYNPIIYKEPRKEKDEHGEDIYIQEDNDDEEDTQSWLNITLTCKQWYKVCVELLPILNTPQAFKRVLDASFSCSGSLPSSVKVELRHNNGRILFPSQDESNQTQVCSSHFCFGAHKLQIFKR